MCTRSSRTLLLVLGVLASGLTPAPAAAQARQPAYHMLVDDAFLPTAQTRLNRVTAVGRWVDWLSGRGTPAIRLQTSQVPYYGKNRPRYDTFEWQIYRADHFEVFYYPELEHHLERVVSYAESAYQHISAELKHDLAERVPLILYKTQSEFQEQNIAGEELPEGVLAFAEPERNRMVLPIDEAPDQLYSLITHELTHIFEFNIIPRGVVGSGLPLWVDEGLADYMTGSWNSLDLMSVRDAALTDSVPSMSHLESAPLSGRTPYSLGHATFEFIEAKWGKEGLRNFLFSLRKSVLGGSDSAYEEALKVKPEEFDEQFDRYLKERFKPFRDKERPADYGRNLAPDPDRTEFVSVVSIDPSPSGDILAAVVGNRKDQELDIVLVSSKDGQVIRNLTGGFDKDRGFEYIAYTGGLRGNLVPWIAWAPVGDRVAYFVRTEKNKTLIVQNIVTGKVDRRFLLKKVDGPESPAFSPDGRKIAFAAISGGVTDIYSIDVNSGELTNLTKDATADYAPAYAPDGKAMVYTARAGANDKLFRLDLTTGQKRQITFGAHNDTGAKFYDDNTIVFTSTAVDPNATVSPEMIRNGDIPNVWTLDMASGELKQWTDTLTGNVSPVVLRQSVGLRVAFVSYYKGRNGIHIISPDKPVATVASNDFGGPGPVFEFTPPITHTVLRDNIRRKGPFEGMSLAGRPPVALGVTSGGDLYGNTEVTFTDVLADRQINFYAQSVAQYRTTALTYVATNRRLQYAIQGFSDDSFYYAAQDSAALYDPALAPYIDRDAAQAVRSQRGGTIYGIYPFNRYTRAELFGGFIHTSERYVNDGLQALANQYQVDQFGEPIFRNGLAVPFGMSLVRETTIFRDYGPVAGSTMKLTYSGSPDFGRNFLSRNTLDADARYYVRLAENGVLAFRFRGLRSWGQNPDFQSFGGNSELRGYDYLQFIGHKMFFSNAELRFPLITAMLTPLGVLGGLRGVLFAGVGAGGFNEQNLQFMAHSPTTVDVVTGYEFDPNTGDITTTHVASQPISGLRLVDGRASYGMGLESFFLGFPMHFDWSWRTLLNRDYEDTIYRTCQQTGATSVGCGGDGATWRKPRFSFWIGYDF